MKSVIKYGLITGTTYFLYISFLVVLSESIPEIIRSGMGYISIVILPFATYLALREIQQHSLSERLTFAKAILYGTTLALIAALFQTVLRWASIHIFPEIFLSPLIEEAQKEASMSGNSTFEIESAGQAVSAHYYSFRPLRNIVIWYTGLGFIYSSASYLILRNRKKQKQTI